MWTSLGNAFQASSHGLNALWESASWPRPSWERPLWPDVLARAQVQRDDIRGWRLHFQVGFLLFSSKGPPHVIGRKHSKWVLRFSSKEVAVLKIKSLNEVRDSTVWKIEKHWHGHGVRVSWSRTVPQWIHASNNLYFAKRAATIERQNCNDPVGMTRVPLVAMPQRNQDINQI